jgi:hypothetical protein
LLKQDYTDLNKKTIGQTFFKASAAQGLFNPLKILILSGDPDASLEPAIAQERLPVWISTHLHKVREN